MEHTRRAPSAWRCLRTDRSARERPAAPFGYPTGVRRQAVRRTARAAPRRIGISVLVVLLLALAACRSAHPGDPGTGAAHIGGPVEPVPAEVGPWATSVPTAVDVEAGSTAVEPSPSRPASAPARARTLYEAAGARYGVSPALLAALHRVGSGSAGDGCVRNRQGSGAIGPFQFKPATFRAYGVDGDGDGRADICRRADGLYSAARYLRALGADAEPTSPASRRATGPT
jgi:Transglycosylase SLT domain